MLRENHNHKNQYVSTTQQYSLQQVLHRARSSDSSFKLQYFVFYTRSFSRCLRLLPRFPVTSTFPSVTCFEKRHLRQIWPTQLTFLLCFTCRMFLFSSPLRNTSSFITRSIQMVFYILIKQHISKLTRSFWFTVRIVQSLAPAMASPSLRNTRRTPLPDAFLTTYSYTTRYAATTSC